MSDIMERISALGPEQRALFFKKLAEKKPKNPDGVIPVSATENKALPLSPAQQRLWFLEQLAGPGPTYNIPCALRLRGELNILALKNSFQKIIDRHAVLRTRFTVNGTSAAQIIQKDYAIDLPIETVVGNLETAILAEAEKPFDLQLPPLLRVKLLKIADLDHVLLLTIHHIIADGWSLGVLVNEMTAVYNSYLQSKELVDLPKLPIQYADYGLWQIEQLHSEDITKQINYWRQKLLDLPPLLKLPTDKPRIAIQNYQGDSVNFFINKELVNKINILSNQFNVTPFMLLLTAFKILLYRYSGQEDVAVGSSIANRNRSETEPLIGFFVNTLVLRTQLEVNKSWPEILNAVKRITLEAYDNQDVPFDHLVEILKPERNLSYSPLFQVEFTLQNTPSRLIRLENLQVEVIRFPSKVSKFDLNFSLEEGVDGIEGVCEYSVNLFTSATIQRMIDHFINLLNDMVADPKKKIIDLNMLTAAERNELVVEWNKIASPYQLDKLAHVLFSEQAKRLPEKIAVKHNQQVLTYLELEERSNQLAHLLIAKGLDRESRVALFLPRGIDYLVGMLAILKAGGVFIPLDPDSPMQRNKAILNHSRPFCILTKRNYALDHPTIIDVEDSLLKNYPQTPVDRQIKMSDLAYLIYTSGSTGEPKGVMIEHRGMINHLLAKIFDLKISEKDIVGQIAIQTFDVSIWQFLCGLLVGGQVVILTGSEAWEPRALLKSVMQEKISILESVPSHTDILLDEIGARPDEYHLNHLKYYISNAEPLPLEQWRRWVNLNPAITMVNTYGTTECSDDTSHLHLDNSFNFQSPYIPTCGVLPNMQIYVLDVALNPVPIGVTGEIYVGGAGVGRGYFNDPERTAQVFIPDHFSKVPGAKLYRTGDLARYHPDRTLECIGRKDFQLKIRGLRVEIPEIEAVLRKHPQMLSTLVLPIFKDEENYLIGYLVPNSHPAPTEIEIREYCAQYLPFYMIPAYFIFLDELPLLANGKVDRSQLPRPDEYKTINQTTYVAPSSDLEVQFTNLWAKTLRLDKVGIHDNFFHIGGHSLVAVELVRGMEEILGKNITLQKIFETPTIDGILKNL